MHDFKQIIYDHKIKALWTNTVNFYCTVNSYEIFRFLSIEIQHACSFFKLEVIDINDWKVGEHSTAIQTVKKIM